MSSACYTVSHCSIGHYFHIDIINCQFGDYFTKQKLMNLQENFAHRPDITCYVPKGFYRCKNLNFFLQKNGRGDEVAKITKLTLTTSSVVAIP